MKCIIYQAKIEENFGLLTTASDMIKVKKNIDKFIVPEKCKKIKNFYHTDFPVKYWLSYT